MACAAAPAVTPTSERILEFSSDITNVTGCSFAQNPVGDENIHRTFYYIIITLQRIHKVYNMITIPTLHHILHVQEMMAMTLARLHKVKVQLY